jgi:hypothetical protein
MGGAFLVRWAHVLEMIAENASVYTGPQNPSPRALAELRHGRAGFRDFW